MNEQDPKRTWLPFRLYKEIDQEPQDSPVTPLFFLITMPVILGSLVALDHGGNPLAVLGIDSVFIAAIAASPLFLTQGVFETLDRRWSGGSLVQWQRRLARFARRLNRVLTLTTLFVLPGIMVITFVAFVVTNIVIFAFAFGYALVALILVGLPALGLDIWTTRTAQQLRQRTQSKEQDQPPLTLRVCLETAQKNPWLPVVVIGLLVLGVVLQVLATVY